MTLIRQPSDEWDFVPSADDDEVQLAAEHPAELEAVHVDQPRTVAQDPGRAEVVLDSQPAPPSSRYFDDEEPDPSDAVAPDEHEPDLEELLESQHYAFTPEPT